MNSKPLIVVPDLHHSNIWERIVSIEGVENARYVFLGDYFDSHSEKKVGFTFNDALDNFSNIVSFARSNETEVTLLLGNHEFHYIHSFLSFSGKNHIFASAIRELIMVNRDILQLYYFDSSLNLLCSHAGVSTLWLSKSKESLGYANALHSYSDWYNKGNTEWAGFEGLAMGNDMDSPIWIRPNRLENTAITEFNGITGISQVVGHTHKDSPLELTSNILLLDTLKTKEVHSICYAKYYVNGARELHEVFM